MKGEKLRGQVTNFNTFSKPQASTSILQPNQVCRACGILQVSLPSMLWIPADTITRTKKIGLWTLHLQWKEDQVGAQTDIVRNIIQEDTINKHSWNSLPKSKDNPCSPAPSLLQYTIHQDLGLTGTASPHRTQFCAGQDTVLCWTGQSCWRFHSSSCFLLV